MVKTVLAIEDDEITQLLTKMALQDAGFCTDTIEALDGLQALAFFEKLAKENDALEKLPEVVLLDLNMPVMSGWQFLEAFQVKYPIFIEKINIFILSSSISPTDKERAAKERFVKGFLSKPLDEPQINKLKAEIEFSCLGNVPTNQNTSIVQ